MPLFLLKHAEDRNEILPDFVLFEPSTIRINVFNCYCLSNPSIAATVVHSRDNPMNPTISIYLEAFEVND
jgi:hypothetical protein